MPPKMVQGGVHHRHPKGGRGTCRTTLHVFGEQSGRRKEHHLGKEVDSSRVGQVTVVRVFCCVFVLKVRFDSRGVFSCLLVLLVVQPSSAAFGWCCFHTLSMWTSCLFLSLFLLFFVVLFVYLLTTTQRRRDQSSTTQKEGAEGSTDQEEEAAPRQRRMWTQHHPKVGRISQHHSRGENSTTQTKSGTAEPPRRWTGKPPLCSCLIHATLLLPSFASNQYESFRKSV